MDFDFGIFLDFLLRPGGNHTEAFREALGLVDLAEATGLDSVPSDAPSGSIWSGDSASEW